MSLSSHFVTGLFEYFSEDQSFLDEGPSHFILVKGGQVLSTDGSFLAEFLHISDGLKEPNIHLFDQESVSGCNPG